MHKTIITARYSYDSENHVERRATFDGHLSERAAELVGFGLLAELGLSCVTELGEVSCERIDDNVDQGCGRLNADAIIAYDLERATPSSESVHVCIRQIANKPHRAPLYLSDLVNKHMSFDAALLKMLADNVNEAASPWSAHRYDDCWQIRGGTDECLEYTPIEFDTPAFVNWVNSLTSVNSTREQHQTPIGATVHTTDCKPYSFATLPEGWSRLEDDNEGPRIAGPRNQRLELDTRQASTQIFVHDGKDYAQVDLAAVRAFFALLDSEGAA